MGDWPGEGRWGVWGMGMGVTVRAGFGGAAWGACGEEVPPVRCEVRAVRSPPSHPPGRGSRVPERAVTEPKNRGDEQFCPDATITSVSGALRARKSGSSMSGGHVAKGARLGSHEDRREHHTWGGPNSVGVAERQGGRKPSVPVGRKGGGDNPGSVVGGTVRRTCRSTGLSARQ